MFCCVLVHITDIGCKHGLSSPGFTNTCWGGEWTKNQARSLLQNQLCLFFFPPIDIKHTALTDRTVFRKLVILITATPTELLSLSSEVSIYQAESLPSPAETQPPQSHCKSTTRDNLGQLYACFSRESMSNLVLPCLTPTPPAS